MDRLKAGDDVFPWCMEQLALLRRTGLVEPSQQLQTLYNCFDKPLQDIFPPPDGFTQSSYLAALKAKAQSYKDRLAAENASMQALQTQVADQSKQLADLLAALRGQPQVLAQPAPQPSTQPTTNPPQPNGQFPAILQQYLQSTVPPATNTSQPNGQLPAILQQYLQPNPVQTQLPQYPMQMHAVQSQPAASSSYSYPQPALPAQQSYNATPSSVPQSGSYGFDNQAGFAQFQAPAYPSQFAPQYGASGQHLAPSAYGQPHYGMGQPAPPASVPFGQQYGQQPQHYGQQPPPQPVQPQVNRFNFHAPQPAPSLQFANQAGY
ncbi:hypothetical protein BJ508DRAFT_326251, partial [Ascobolus immersus RN42]